MAYRTGTAFSPAATSFDRSNCERGRGEGAGSFVFAHFRKMALESSAANG